MSKVLGLANSLLHEVPMKYKTAIYEHPHVFQYTCMCWWACMHLVFRYKSRSKVLAEELRGVTEERNQAMVGNTLYLHACIQVCACEYIQLNMHARN